MREELVKILKYHLEDRDEPYEALNTLIQLEVARVHHIKLNSAEPPTPPRHIGDYIPSKALFSVNASDIFAWGCADSEFIESEAELWQLAELVAAEPKFGEIHWLCHKRQQQPQPPWIERLKEAGAWDELLQNLPANKMDRKVHESLGINYDQIVNSPPAPAEEPKQ